MQSCTYSVGLESSTPCYGHILWGTLKAFVQRDPFPIVNCQGCQAPGFFVNARGMSTKFTSHDDKDKKKNAFFWNCTLPIFCLSHGLLADCSHPNVS